MKKSNITLLLFALLMLAGNQMANAQRITVTIAGNGTAGYSGDQGWGKLASISAPYDVCMDAAGNVYFTDMGNGRVRKVSVKNGVITTVAGGGTSTLDGIPAINAAISPKNICIDAAGNLYVVSTATNQIKRIDAVTNIITTVAGTGSAGFSGDGGPAISATFNGILGICISSAGNIFLSDSGNSRIREIAAGTGIVTTIAGTGVASYTGDGGPAIAATLHSPTALTVNPAGDVFVMDQSGYTVFNAQLRKISAATGIISTIAGGSGGPVFGSTLMNTYLADVTGLCMDGDGNFFCNEVSCSCRELDMTTDSTYAVGGNFGIESYSENVNSNLAYMDNPYGICIDGAQNVYVADNFNNRIRKLIQLTHTPTFAFGQGEYLYTCPGSTVSFDSLLTITDLDAGQTETYTVVTPPAHGSLSGFPVSSTSNGTVSTSAPSGVSYTASGSYAGTDSFQVQVSDGALTDVVTIYVDAGVASIAGPSGVCTGATISLSDAFGTGTWSVSNANASISSSGVVTGNIGGTDVVSYFVINSCGEETTESTITITPLPDAGTIVTPVTIVCKGSTVTMTDASTGGTWSADNTNASVSSGAVTGLAVGTDVISYTVVNSCGNATATEAIEVVHCTSEGVPVVSNPVPNIFPNPASDVLNIQWDGLVNSNATVSMTDVTGREVLRSDINNNGSSAAEVNVSGLKDGIYLITISSDTEHFTDKITITK